MKLLFKLPNLKFYLPLLAASTAAMGGVLLAQASVLAAEYTVATNLSYEHVSQETAIANGINVSVNPGRIAVIDFSTTDEAISYIGLGDASRVVYNTDFPIPSGTAQTIFLLPIEELDFPGATTAKITNLVAKTVDAKGVSRVYNFQINHSNSVANLGIKITPQIRNRIANSDRQVIKVSYGRAANLNDVERGLKLAIDRGYTKADDPVVAKVKRFTALVRNGDLSVIESAETVGVDLAVISSLAEMALEQFSFVKQDGSSFSLTTESSLDSGEKEFADEKGLAETKKTDRLLLRREGYRKNKIQQKFPSVSSTTTKNDVNGSLEEFQDTESLDTIIPDSNKKLPAEQKSKDSTQTTFKTVTRSTLIDPDEDLSIYLTKVASVPSLAQKNGREDDQGFALEGRRRKGDSVRRMQAEGRRIESTYPLLLENTSSNLLNRKEFGSSLSFSQTSDLHADKYMRLYAKRYPLGKPLFAPSALKLHAAWQRAFVPSFDERVENALKAHDLYFGWQRVVRQEILDIDDETENKVNRAISLVRRGKPIKAALKDAQVGIQVSSFLLAISADDTEALASLSANVARSV